jgi:hypothetical protein
MQDGRGMRIIKVERVHQRTVQETGILWRKGATFGEYSRVSRLSTQCYNSFQEYLGRFTDGSGTGSYADGVRDKILEFGYEFLVQLLVFDINDELT